MESSKSLLDLMVFEVRYPFGHLYWDRCGQSILDIETQCGGWFSAKLDNHVGRLENPEKNLVVMFSENSFSMTARKLREPYIESFIEESQNTWKIIRSNFGLEEFDRMGLRFHYLIPTKSIQEAELAIKKSELNIKIPQQLSSPQYELATRHITTIFQNEDMEYRVELKAVVRSEGADPASLLTGRPDKMPKRQKEYRIQKMKLLKDYSVNPMYAVMLDIDCSSLNIDLVNIKEFVTKQEAVVINDFLQILEKK